MQGKLPEKNSSVSESLIDYSYSITNKESIKSYLNQNSEDASSKKCFICYKGFILRRKIICYFCLCSFCSEHCTRKRKINPEKELVNICEDCNKEETKKEIAQEIDEEIIKLSNDLKKLQETNEKLFKEYFNNTGSLNNIDMEIKKQE